MAAIPDLAAASAVAATDLLVINQSGTDRKVSADKFVTVDGNSKTTAVKEIALTRATIANNAAQAIVGVYGLLIVQNETDGGQALVWLSASSVSIINQTAGNFGTTQGTASKINVYISGGVCYLENKLGASKIIGYVVLGS